MLSLLPQILFLSPVAATLIRLTVALMLAYSSWRNASRPGYDVRAFALLEALVAAAVFAGAWTQAAAIIGALMLGLSLIMTRFSVWPRSTVVMLLVMTLTLIVTGPGAIAFDLPL